ncbi:MAG: chemotaxis protein CheX [Treponema sp.]|jgi:chemotaxis protein CheX|nr:chemotaxis protein CheX [Treponema sp.]
MEQYIQPFIEVSVRVFKEFLHCDLTADRAYFTEKEDFQAWDISGIIGLSGEARGAVAISMKTETAVKIADMLTNTPHTYLDSDVIDAVGEIVNIIAGNVKKHLEEMFQLVISLPSIVKGKAHAIVWPSERTRIICIPFKIFSGETICLSVAINTGK